MKRFAIIVATLGTILAGHTGLARADDVTDCTRGDPDQVITGCTRLLEAGGLKPRIRALVYTTRGIAFQKKGQFDRAIDDFDQAIAIDPKHANSYLNRGMTYAFKRQFNRALKDLDTAIAIDPEQWQAYVNRGVVYRAAGEIERAISDYTEAIKRKPDHPIAFMNRAYARGLIGESEKAHTDIKAALALDPNNAEIHHGLGDLEFYAGKPDRATEAWQKACELAPSEVTLSWQRDLAVVGHYVSAIDGRCDERVVNAFRSCARERCLLLFLSSKKSG